MIIDSLQSQLDAFDQPALYESDTFQARATVVDAIAEIIDRIDELRSAFVQPHALHALRRTAELLQLRLLAVDEMLFADLRSLIRDGYRGELLQESLRCFRAPEVTKVVSNTAVSAST